MNHTMNDPSKPCQHKWRVLDKTVLPSPYQQVYQGATHFDSVSPSEMTDDPGAFTVKLVLIVTCDVCGELREFNEENP